MRPRAATRAAPTWRRGYWATRRVVGAGAHIRPRLRDRTEPYDLGEQEFHLAFRTDRFDELLARHKAMGCVCFENPDMGIYFIEDPDGYWIELVPAGA